jgi:hypothetical protein
MKRPPLIMLYDLENGIGAAEGMAFGGNVPKLIDPTEAISWIATSKFGEVIGPRPWMFMRHEDMDDYFSRESGKNELAEEIIFSGIRSGRLRCAYVNERPGEMAKLASVDPTIFLGKKASFDWGDSGLTVQVFENDDDEDYIEFDKFWFFWDEVVALVPPRITPDDVWTAPPAVPSPAPPERKMPTHSYSEARSTRGRPAGKNGEPIAMFVLRIQSEGVENVEAISDDALGAMLEEEYFRLGLKAPNNINAARDARGAVRALMKARAKIDGGTVK